MEVNVAQLLKSPIGETRDYEVKETVACGETERPVAGKVKFTRTDRGILVEGKLKTIAELTCSRCLRQFSSSLALNILEEFFPAIDVITGAPLAVPDEPGAFTIDEHHILDLNEAICQYTLMAIPMKPLCREDCAGLCPVCGKDQNLGACNCPAPETDPRWEKLKELSATLAANKRKKNRKG